MVGPRGRTERTDAIILGPDIVGLLYEIGLTWEEVRIYQFLLNAPSAVASAVVRETGQPRGRIYQTLRGLVEKGMASEEPTTPISFHATPLSQVLDRAHDRLKRQLETVEAVQAKAPDDEPAEVAVPILRPARPGDVRVFSGRRACCAEWRRLAREAEGFYWLAGGGRLANRIAAMPTLLEELVDAQGRGVTVQLFLPETEGTSEAVDALTERLGGEPITLAMADHLGPLTSCATETSAMELIAQPDDDEPNQGDDIGIEVSSALFAHAMKYRFEVMGDLLGGGSPPVYRWLGPSPGAKILQDAIRAAQNEVQVMGPRDWASYAAADWDVTSRLYEEARERGVRFRALTSLDEEQADELGPLSKIWDIRVVDLRPVWLTLVDGQQLYQAFAPPAPDRDPRFRQSREPTEVGFYSTVFERLWDSALPIGQGSS